MKFVNYIEQLNNSVLAKRVASAYVADYRKLNMDEIKECLKKTKEQYCSLKNISERIEEIKLDSDRNIRIIAPILLRDYLLDQDDFISTYKTTESFILGYEKNIVDEANNIDSNKLSSEFNLFSFMIETAWQHNDNISVDEKNLLEALRKYLSITNKEQHIIEAKFSRFPKKGNILHTLDEIDKARKALQLKGLLMSVKNSDGEMCDVIPEEIAAQIRKYYNIEMRSYGYEKMLEYVVRKTRKQYLIDIVSKTSQNKNRSKLEIPNNPTVNELKDIIFTKVQPSNLLGGYSLRDGLDVEMLQNWCSEIGIMSSGNKASLIERLIHYYDSVRKVEVKTEDTREQLLNYYEMLAARELKQLRANGVLQKDLQCEHYFEDATNYIFEKILLNKPLTLVGTDHPDGKLSFKDKYIMWDNKSKEKPVNLKDHIQQFDKYIKSSDKEVVVFMVIAPSFTSQSIQECVNYALNNDTQILLITASEFKNVADIWKKKHEGEIFNLGYFKQNGRFDINLLNL